jgi:hypothetical protein
MTASDSEALVLHGVLDDIYHGDLGTFLLLAGEFLQLNTNTSLQVGQLLVGSRKFFCYGPDESA